MTKSNNFKDFLQLREEFTFFVYKGVDYQYSDKGLRAQFHFNLADKYSFHPTMIIPAREFFVKENIKEEFLDNLLFHIGMIELISYWKAACPPKIIIECRTLDTEQVRWWKKLYYKGLSEFFYLNSIETNEIDFVDIQCSGSDPIIPFRVDLEDSIIIPIGGGKDSVVTLELLNNKGGSLPLIMNPRAASMGCTRKKGYFYDSIIEIQRTLDPLLLELNGKGFLNGHTPFSALLAFSSAVTAILAGRKYIALSNESSANESTVRETLINHQYSKSFEFEADFRWYVRNYITEDLEYFSFLRPLNELQIAKLFSTFPDYFNVFKSCNAGSKNDTWCGKCAKCLFTWIILSPFLDQDRLVCIFGKNLLDDPALIPLFDELTGVAESKPFDCIGTIDEVNAALVNLVTRLSDSDYPVLIRHYLSSAAYGRSKGMDIQSLLSTFNPDHFLPEKFETILRSSLYGGTSEK
jgi:UDP-N-acetyl-alpha-D-muramoyl-L-alanyl-L-glutamate epimerase